MLELAARHHDPVRGVRRRVEEVAVDPGNRYGVPYTWGTLGLGMNVEAVQKRLPNVPLNSLDLLFKPEYASKLKDCGIAILDSPQEVIGLALHYLGKNPYSTDQQDLAAAEALLHQLQPNVLYVATGRQISDLANGSVCLALTYNGDASMAADQARKAKSLTRWPTGFRKRARWCGRTTWRSPRMHRTPKPLGPSSNSCCDRNPSRR